MTLNESATGISFTAPIYDDIGGRHHVDAAAGNFAAAERAVSALADALNGVGEHDKILLRAAAGAGKSFALVRMVQEALQHRACTRVAITAFANKQVFPLAGRLGAELGADRVCLFVAKDRQADVPPDVQASVTIAVRATEIPASAEVVLGTSHKLGAMGERGRLMNHLGAAANGDRIFDVLLVDEAWQLALHRFNAVEGLARIVVGVGDVGQLPPLDPGQNPWRGDPGYNPYRAWPTAHEHTPSTFTVDLPAVWRPTAEQLPLWRAFYNDWDQLVPGELARFSNVEDGHFLTRPRTILVDSAQLESGEAMKADFKRAAAVEIEAFKADFRRRNPGADAESLTDEDLLREVMNTVGKKGKLGEGVRCVVSVAMLTEGWDANTVTHILGIRAFGSQLLCEQVVGRGLRRRSYALGEDGKFEPEYANVYGIPFAFIPSDGPGPDPLPRPPAIMVESLPGREHLRIEFPKLDGYRVEIPDERLMFDAATAEHFPIGPSTVPTRTDVEGVIGKGEIVTDDDAEGRRRQEVAYRLAARLLRTHLTALGDDPRPWLFPQLVEIAQQWLEQCVDIAPGCAIGHLLTSTEGQAEAAEAIHQAIAVQVGNRRERLRPMIRRFDPVGSTAEIAFPTRKAVVTAEKSEVSHVTLDGKDGNTWEQLLAAECELNRDVVSYVKNDHLGFVIPYVHKGRTHSYVPDFLVRLKPREDDVVRTLIIEVSGGQKSPGPTKAKADTARDQWCVAVNNHGGFGRWGYVEITTMLGVRARLSEAIDSLYADDPIVGDPDLLDYDEVTRGA